MNEKIISIKTFNWEYTAIQYIDKVIRVNSICGNCWLHISSFTKRDLTGMAVTAKKRKCDLCKELTYTSSIHNYL